MILAQDKAYEVESLARMYTTDGPFSESFLRVTFYNLDATHSAEMDINGIVPLPPRVPITFDCKSGGKNVSNIHINMGLSTGVVVYWTKYRGFVWNKES